MAETTAIERKYKMTGELTRRKLVEFFPAMLMTNLSTLLLVNVDGIVVGNFVGKDALSSVSIFGPVTTFLGVISMLVSSGASARLSDGMGKIDLEGLLKARAALKRLMVIIFLALAVVQVPFVAIIIRTYNLSPEINGMVWSYAIGVMISIPFGFISTIGVLQLQIVGKMKALMGLAAMEGCINLVLDLLFVAVFDMGVAGAGFGTAGANIVRATVTVLYLAKKTDVFFSGDQKATWKEAGSILYHGLPDATNSLMLALQGYVLMSIILRVFGQDGGTIRGVFSFADSLFMVLIGGAQGAMRPLSGLLSGAQDLKGLRHLMKQGMRLVTGAIAILLIAIEIFPELLYRINGVKDIPEGGVACLRISVFYALIYGINTLFRLYFTNRKAVKYTTTITVIGNCMTPLFALFLLWLFPSVWMWLCYTLTEIVIIVSNEIKYKRMQRADREMIERDEKELHLTVVPEDAIEVSRQIRAYAEENGIDRKHAFRAALCMEEMVAYAEKSDSSRDVNLQVVLRFFEDSAMLMIMDDGKCIFLDREEATQEIITSNYGLLKKLSKSVEYQYILNLNYTVCRY